TWITSIACPYLGSDAINALRDKGNELIDPIEKRPFISFVGSVLGEAAFITEVENYNTQWVSIVPVPLSETAPLEIASAVTGAASRAAQNNPALPAKTLPLPGIRPPNENWKYT